MGPEEYVSREELGVVVRFMFAKFQQQAETIAALADLLVSSGTVTDQAIKEMAERLAASPSSVRTKQCHQVLRDFAAIHKIARQYLDPPDE